MWLGIESALGMIGAPAVEPIIENLIGEPAALGGFATKALTRIGAPAVDPLIATLEEEDFERNERVVETLGDIGKQLKDKVLRTRIIETLIAITGMTDAYDGSIRVCAAASVALREITGKDFGIDADQWQKWMKEQK